MSGIKLSKPFKTSYGQIEQTTPATLTLTSNNTGVYISFNLIGIVILSMSFPLMLDFLFLKNPKIFEISRNIFAENLLTAPAINYVWVIAFLVCLFLWLAIDFLIKARIIIFCKYLSGLMFFTVAFLLACSTNIPSLSRQLALLVSKILLEIPYFGSIFVLLFLIYLGISLWNSPYPHEAEKIIVFDQNEGLMTERNIVYPLPLAFFSNVKIRFGRLPVLKEKYEYPLSDIVSIHKYTCDGGDEFTYYTTLNFGKTNTYFLAQWSKTERENQQVIEILSGFLAVPLGNDLNKKKVGFSNPLLSSAFENIFNPERLKEERSQIIL